MKFHGMASVRAHTGSGDDVWLVFVAQVGDAFSFAFISPAATN
jgi:hypothetical protein